MSKRFTLNAEDLKRVAKNALVFLAPALLVALADVARVLPDWFNGPYLVIALFLVNIITDGIRKFINGK